MQKDPGQSNVTPMQSSTTPDKASEKINKELPVAGGGLLSRRSFITKTAGGSLFLPVSYAAGANFDRTPETWLKPGSEFSNYGTPPDNKEHPIRWISNHPAVPGEGVSWTPHHQLYGTITPNGLHFERHHNGVPHIDVSTWEVAVHGLADTPTAFSLDDLHRLPFHTRQLFIECGGNSNAMWQERPAQTAAGYIHGLMSCSEWTGVLLSDLLQRVGMDSDNTWIIADGLDSAGVTTSFPVEKAVDDALIALYQNGEPIRPEQGYPARLILPGWEGIRQIKWLRSLQISNRPLLSKYDTVSYTELMPDGTFDRFSFAMDVKSFISQPSPGIDLTQPGLYEIQGLAWSGHGKIKRVEVSADGGTSWADAHLQEPVLDHSLVRFRIPWRWSGAPASLLSRATDSQGNIQPDRKSVIASKGSNSYYHYNGDTVWSVEESGRIQHAYL